jgi:hypothetical protein
VRAGDRVEGRGLLDAARLARLRWAIGIVRGGALEVVVTARLERFDLRG